MKGFIVDVESKHMTDGSSAVFSVSMMFFEFTVRKQWKSRGRGFDPEYQTSIQTRYEPLQTIFIAEALQDPCVSEDVTVVRKLGQTIVDTVRVGGTVISLPFSVALKHMMTTMKDSTWFGHSIDRDIQFLVDTDERYKTRMFRKDPSAYPESCCVFPEWPGIAKVCTQQILTRRCPKFIEKYIKAGGSSARLAELVTYVTGRTQHHTSAQDVIDTASVVQKAFEDDRFQIETGKSYMTCIPLRTSLLLNQGPS
jgi:hypothetical protein